MVTVALKQIELFQHWEYFLLNILGVLFLLGFAVYVAWRSSFSWRNILFYAACIPLVFIAGARLFYIFFYANHSNLLIHFYAPKLYGFSLYGGLFMVVLYLTIVAWFNRISVWNWLDSHTPGLMSCVALGKTGCFLNGCCFGIPTIMPWGIPYAQGSQAYKYYIIQALDHLPSIPGQVYSDRIHPVQLYESGSALIILFVALYLLRKKARSGLVFLLTVGLYSLTRWGLFYLRAKSETANFYYILPWLYIIIASLSLGVLFIKIFQIREEV
jgi:phosphatidylglycerol:prolipoprotein diacylglycerol transferase